jgi:hypothetical protein
MPVEDAATSSMRTFPADDRMADTHASAGNGRRPRGVLPGRYTLRRLLRGTTCGLFDVIEECELDRYQCHEAWVVVRDCRAEGLRCANLDGEITCVP